MPLSDHAAAAKQIRTMLKKHSIKATVRASQSSMTDSVDVTIFAEPPWVVEAIKSFANRYQYGHFDGMIDCYEYSNTRNDIPQVKFIFVDNKFTTKDRQRAYDYLRANFAGYEDAPPDVEDSGNYRVNDSWADQEIWQVLTGALDKRSSCKYWHKPQIKL